MKKSFIILGGGGVGEDVSAQNQAKLFPSLLFFQIVETIMRDAYSLEKSCTYSVQKLEKLPRYMLEEKNKYCVFGQKNQF